MWLSEFHRDLEAAQKKLTTQQKSLDDAKARAKEAEGRYKELQSLAEKHQHYGDTAEKAASEHNEKYQVYLPTTALSCLFICQPDGTTLTSASQLVHMQHLADAN